MPSPYLSKIFLSLATHKGVLCGVAVETASLSWCGFADWASAGGDSASSNATKKPLSIDLPFIYFSPPLFLYSIVASLPTLTIRRFNFRSFTSFTMPDHVILNTPKNLCVCDSCTRGDSLKGQQTKFDMIRGDWIVYEQSFYWRCHAYCTWST